MLKWLCALGLAATLSLAAGSAAADVAGGPPGTGGEGGTGGTGGTGDGGKGDGGKGNGGKGEAGSGGSTTDDKGGGCAAATPGTASRTAVIAVGLGLLLAVPAVRKRREKGRKKGG